jgi:GNAT superfamily N-acetyltransferase
VTRLLQADSARFEEILDGTYAIWGEGLSRYAYGAWNRAQMSTEWGRTRLRRLALLENDTLLASAKRYDLSAIVDGANVPVLGIGAVFTPEPLRGRGHARALIELMVQEARARGCHYALLFSEIGAPYYEAMGFRVVPRHLVSIDVQPMAGSPMTFVRSGETTDLPAIAEISRRYAAGSAFALDRSWPFLAFVFARRRLLAGLDPTGERHVEFFVAEEGHRPVAYVFVTRGPRGAVLEECGDLDPSGARIGAIVQVLAARHPTEPPVRLTGWLPASIQPPQLLLNRSVAAPEIMMIRPLLDVDSSSQAPASAAYWQTDVF